MATHADNTESQRFRTFAEMVEDVISKVGTPPETVATSGVKHDKEKPRYELIPPELLGEVAKVLTFGAVKYGDRNWEKGMCWGRIFAASQRHLWAWWSGKDKDDETGYSHLAHAACCLAFLLAYESRRLGTDDREKVST